MHLVTIGQAFDGGDLLSIGLDGQNGAGFDRLAVQMDGAGSTRRRVTSNVGPGQADRVSDQMDQQRTWLNVMAMAGAVDLNGYLHEVPFQKRSMGFLHKNVLHAAIAA